MPKSTLTKHDVSLIRREHFVHGVGYGTLAKRFGVEKATIQQVCTFRTWKHVPCDYSARAA